MRGSNVLRFPPKGSGGHPSNDNSVKLFAVIFYLFLAWTLRHFLGLAESGLWLLILLGVLYNVFIRHRAHQGSAYFRKNGLMLAILLVLALIIYPANTLAILALAALYWLLVGRASREAPYFLRFHILTGLILNFFLLMPCLLFAACMELVFSLLRITSASAMLPPNFFALYQTGLSWFTLVLFWGAAGWLAFNVLRGRTPFIRIVTDNVRHWA